MAEVDATETEGGEEAPKKRSKLPLLIGFVLALAGGGGGFFAVSSGMILGGEKEPEKAEAIVEEPDALPDVVFLPVDPLVVSLGRASRNDYLRFRAQLEVYTRYQDDVAAIMPRVVDVLNGYLRAVNIRDLEDPSALFRLRAQMLRRIQIVTGEGRVRDLLVMEFVLN